jgi:putative ABC transport system substrate-binding protein
MRRREFITLLGGAATAWPLAARAQQPAIPVIGLLSSLTESERPRVMIPFNEGLGEAGYVEGRNVAIEYRWSDGQYDQLPALAAELVHRQVAMIAAISIPVALAAKAATATIPIVFTGGADPVEVGLVPSLSRPGGNITGVNTFGAELGSKGLGLLHEIVPNASTIALLVNPKNPIAALTTKDVRSGARTISRQIQIFNASNERELVSAFASMVQAGIRALVVGNDSFFNGRVEQLATLAAHHVIPTLYFRREFAVVGGLVSYGSRRSDGFRQAGLYAGRILKGAKAADLPVVQPTKFELIINLRAAKALGVTVPDKLLVAADEVIE